MQVETPATPAPSAPAPVTPPVPSSLAEFRTQRDAAPVEPPAVPSPTVHIAVEEPPEPLEDAGAEPDETPPAEGVKPPEQTPAHRWKDPETGITLDLRRRDHRRIKRALEQGAEVTRERDSLAQRVQAFGRPPDLERPRQAPAEASQPDSSDPEPTLEQFAEEADPYLAHSRALARWDARQEFKTQQATYTRVERARQAQTRITEAQLAFDAELPQVKTRYPDFDDAHQEVLAELGRVPLPVRGPVVHRLLTSPVRHDLTHYLGTHPEDLSAVVSARSAYEQAMTLGAIETRVRALVNQRAAPAPHSPTPPPPAPMAPVGGTGHPATMPDGKDIKSLAQFRALKPKLGMTA